MSEWSILIFVLYIIYLIMKKSKSTTEKPAPKAKAKADQPAKAKAEQPVKAKAEQPIKAKAEQPVATVATKAAPKKPSPGQKAPKKAQAETPKPIEAAPEMTMSERVGLTSGSIWHYLDKNGATAVAKLIRELTEEEKIIQRSIGWLAQEGKITLAVVDRAETIALKD